MRTPQWIWITAAFFPIAHTTPTEPFTPATNAETNKRAFDVLRLLRRADDDSNCPSGYNPCTDLGNSNACCKQGTNCSKDAANNIACCATGASCTGSLTGTTTATTGTGTSFMFPQTASATATSEGTSATDSTIDGAYPFIAVPTAFNNPQSCSSYYSVCQSEYTQCTGALMGRYAVTIGNTDGAGKTVQAVTAASQATSICSSLSVEACHGINLGYCGSVATQTGGSGSDTSDNAASVRTTSLTDLVLGLAVGFAGMFI
ncbi:hypothetical protein PENANT_c005G10348 [Penicillium antarcticum]|uniref:Hydrophobin n=1 Tax=Penicillium antarcticum TaxID=416450 RepID=A0A1V6QEN3_9EURO|nr:uncharacterized protein N7508_007868 [Penicillium antarcticum]KAJ5297619.1 hypothetical protein N7508_007868 [Penicillium antarcticum]OQD87680.1 hypothetical protein PENANT_c005G10348 [Penicillium antarcticum]